MIDLMGTYHNEIPDDRIVFPDGFITIISMDDEYNNPNIEQICICAEYDKPMTLVDITNNYPNVKMLIYEDCLRGDIYKYGNHKDGIWERVGITKGYI